MSHQVVIASYHRDFEWLIHCLASLKKFSSGFLHPIVCVDSKDAEACRAICQQSYPEASVVIKDGRPEQGFMRAQMFMLQADLHSPADVIYFLGSDCIATAPFTPEPYCNKEGKPAVLYSSYAAMGLVHADTLPWKKGTERILGFPVENEYMRRLPSVFPRSVFSAMRNHVALNHTMAFENYIYETDKIYRDTSEANILGAFAHKFMPETCEFVDIATAGLYGTQVVGWPSVIGQFWSWGGLDRPMEACFEYTVNGVKKNSVRQTPRSVINEILYGIH